MPDLSAVDGDLPPRDDIPVDYWIFRQDGAPLAVPNKGIIVTGLNAARGIGQVMWPKIKDAVPPKLLRDKEIQPYFVSSGVPGSIRFPDGGWIFTGTGEQGRLQFEGFDADWAWVDEPIPSWVFNGIWRGLSDRCGPIWFTLTPLGQNATWLREWAEADDVWDYKGNQRENIFLSKETFDSFERDGKYTRAELASRTTGEFELGGDRVFENLDPDVHFIEARPIPDDWLIGLTVDPHHRKPAFCLWWACDPSTEPNWVYHFFREWPQGDFFGMDSGGLSPDEYAVLFRQTEGARPAQVRICDPRFGKAEYRVAGKREVTVWSREMESAGLYFDCNVPGTSRLEIGHTKVTNMLRWDRNYPIGPTNTPRIFIHDSCQNLQKAMKYYAYLQVKDPAGGVHEKVSEEYKDPCDCLRYTVLYQIPIQNIGRFDGENFSERDLMEENENWS